MHNVNKTGNLRCRGERLHAWMRIATEILPSKLDHHLHLWPLIDGFTNRGIWRIAGGDRVRFPGAAERQTRRVELRADCANISCRPSTALPRPPHYLFSLTIPLLSLLAPLQYRRQQDVNSPGDRQIGPVDSIHQKEPAVHIGVLPEE